MQYVLVPVLYAEVNAVCILFLLLVLFKLKGSTLSMNLFRAVLVASCALFVLDALWGLADSEWPLLSVQGDRAVYTLYFFASGPTSFLWYLYSESEQKPQLEKRWIVLSALPLVILLTLVLLSLKTGWVFHVDAADVYHTGPLYTLSLLLTYGYVLVATVKAFVASRRVVSYALKKKYRALSSFGIPTLIAGVLQELLFLDLPILCVGITLALFYVFFSMQEQKISVDGLTNLNNRNKFMQYLSERMVHKEDETRLYLVMMDLDGFKAINDGFGHVEGDRALRKTAEALKACCRDRHHFIARYGGDEFAAVCELNKGESIEQFCWSIRSEMRKGSEDCPYRLSISTGYALYSGQTEQEFIKMADAALYREKRKRADAPFMTQANGG